MNNFKEDNKTDWWLILAIVIGICILIYGKHGNRTERDNGKQFNIESE
jgi:hypothetical protein